MKPKTLISVVMPCYNAEKYLSSAIESILAQSLQDFELIIINDGSTDNSHQEILRHKDSRIKYVPFSRNIGNYPARNAGMAIAKGKYVCVMDADDIAYENRLQLQYDYLENNPRIGAIGGQGKTINSNGELKGNLTNPVLPFRQLQVLLLMNNFVAHPTLMMRTSLLRKYQLCYDESYFYASDFDFISRCCTLFPVQNIDQELIRYRHHSQQISSKHYGMQVDFADRIRLSQLEFHNFNLSDQEKRIYLLLMKRMQLSSTTELTEAMNLLNKLMEQNLRLKAFNRRFLFDFFEYVLAIAQEKMSAENVS